MSKANGNGNLQKLYGALSQRERLAAYFAAAGRNDMDEGRALIRSAPRVHLAQADVAPLFNALYVAASLYVMTQLDTAAVVATLAIDGPEDMFDAAQMAVFLFLVRREGWRSLCAEYGIEPEIFHTVFEFPGETVLEMSGKVAEALAITREEVEAIWKARHGEGELPTPESELSKWRTAIQSFGVKAE